MRRQKCVSLPLKTIQIQLRLAVSDARRMDFTSSLVAHLRIGLHSTNWLFPFFSILFFCFSRSTHRNGTQNQFTIGPNIFDVSIDRGKFAAATANFIISTAKRLGKLPNGQQVDENNSIWSGLRRKHLFAFREIWYSIEHDLATFSRFYATLVINRNNNKNGIIIMNERLSRLIAANCVLIQDNAPKANTEKGLNQFVDVECCVCRSGGRSGKNQHSTQEDEITRTKVVRNSLAPFHPQRNRVRLIESATQYHIHTQSVAFNAHLLFHC